jgi:hypothetical protein
MIDSQDVAKTIFYALDNHELEYGFDIRKVGLLPGLEGMGIAYNGATIKMNFENGAKFRLVIVQTHEGDPTS